VGLKKSVLTLVGSLALTAMLLAAAVSASADALADPSAPR